MGRYGIAPNPRGIGIGLVLLPGESDSDEFATLSPGGRIQRFCGDDTNRSGGTAEKQRNHSQQRQLDDVDHDDLEYSDDEDDNTDREGSSEGSDGTTTDSDDIDNDDEDVSSNEEDNGGTKGDDREEDEDEPPHPLGFAKSRRGVGCRYGIHLGRPLPGADLEDAYRDRMGSNKRLGSSQSQSLLLRSEYRPPQQEFPPLSSYLDPRVASTRDLVRSVRSITVATTNEYPSGAFVEATAASRGEHGRRDNDGDDDLAGVDVVSEIRNSEIREIANLFVSAIPPPVTPSLPPSSSSRRAVSSSAIDLLCDLSVDAQAGPYRGMQKDQQAIRAEIEHLRGPILKEHEDRRKALMRLLRDHEDTARRIQEEFVRRQRDAERKQERLQQQQRLEDERLRAETERKEALEAEKRRQQEEVAKAKDDAERQEREYLVRAQKLMAQLVQLRASVEPFEVSSTPVIKARRLQMKKLVAGKINTLTENSDKIRSVAAEVSRAISAARDDDDKARQQIAGGGDPGATADPEMARGKRYLLDLLSSKVVVRIQAEGFNGYVIGEGVFVDRSFEERSPLTVMFFCFAFLAGSEATGFLSPTCSRWWPMKIRISVPCSPLTSTLFVQWQSPRCRTLPPTHPKTSSWRVLECRRRMTGRLNRSNDSCIGRRYVPCWDFFSACCVSASFRMPQLLCTAGHNISCCRHCGLEASYPHAVWGTWIRN
jgi:hypothetical protein